MNDHYLPGLPLPIPQPDGVDRPFHEGVQAHEIRVQRCGSCGTFQVPPEWLCHQCHAWEIGWETVAPRGIIYSYMRVDHPIQPALQDKVPYLVVLVELPHAGQVKMIGNLMGDPRQDVSIGDPVTAVFEDYDDATLIQWQIQD